MLLAPLEAVVTAIMDDNAILQIADTGQEIAWPLDASENQITVGDTFTICLKPTPAQEVKNIVTAAKTRHIGTGPKNPQAQEAAQKMLEALIN